MLGSYCVTGWSSRFGMWHTEMIEAKDALAAKQRYMTKFTSHRGVRAYHLRRE